MSENEGKQNADASIQAKSDTPQVEKESPKAEQTPKKSETPIKKAPLIIIGIFFILSLGLWAYYFHWGGRDYFRQKYPISSIVTKESPPSTLTDQNEAYNLVKETKGKATSMTVARRLDFYRKFKEKESGKEVFIEGWRMEDASEKGEKGRFVNVHHDWKIGGDKVVFTWLVDLKSKSVEPVSEYAKKLDEFDEMISKTMGGYETADQTSVAPTSTPTVKPSPPDEIKLKPLKQEDQQIDIMPPGDVGIETPERVQPVPKNPPPNPPSSYDYYGSGDEFELKGTLTSGGERKALIMDGSTSKDVSVGGRLSGGWTVSSIGQDTVTIRKGSVTRTLRLRDSAGSSSGSRSLPPPSESSGNYPKAGEYGKTGNYPKAGEYGRSGNYPKASGKKPGDVPATPGKPPGSGPPVIPGPGSVEAPPVPPAPNKPPLIETPNDKPTIIPLD